MQLSGLICLNCFPMSYFLSPTPVSLGRVYLATVDMVTVLFDMFWLFNQMIQFNIQFKMQSDLFIHQQQNHSIFIHKYSITSFTQEIGKLIQNTTSVIFRLKYKKKIARNSLFWQTDNSLLMKLMYFVTINQCVCSNLYVQSQFWLVFLIYSIDQFQFMIHLIILSICFGK